MTDMTNTSTMDMNMTDTITNTITITNMDTDMEMNDTITNMNTNTNTEENMKNTNMPDTSIPDLNTKNTHTNTEPSTNTSPGVDTTRKSGTIALGRTVEPINTIRTASIERKSATVPIMTSASKSCRIPAATPVSEFCALIISHYRARQNDRSRQPQKESDVQSRNTREGSALFSLDELKSNEKGQRETGTSGSANTARREEGVHREGVVVDPSLEVEGRGIRAEPDGAGAVELLSEQSDQHPARRTEMPSRLDITSTGAGGQAEYDDTGPRSVVGGEEARGKRAAPSLPEVEDVDGLARGNKRRKMESGPCILGVSASASRVGYGDGTSRAEVSRGHDEADDRIGDHRPEDVDDEDYDDKGGVEKWVARCQNIGRYRTAQFLVINALVGQSNKCS
jgi:hypothetical protein